ncbi:hypothetical protein Q3V30_12515 [Erwinia pyri]|uniref:Uncharacterized protein n=1 Tax=Erwinia pyri TaxID=3062598 RepID=A0AA50HJG9_9GAMM|nr:hypothetical protein [Erwinia sp. DE2]WLS77313.1 hypothetical protein Q3V30_12515 [Erwinia sp. DE2]
MNEKLVNIVCNKHHLKNMRLENLKYTSGTLELALVTSDTAYDKANAIQVSFDWIHSFRVTDEGNLLKMQYEFKGEMITGIYTIENSCYLTWFSEQSANIHDSNSIKTYLIVTGDEVIEVLSSVKPVMKYS